MSLLRKIRRRHKAFLLKRSTQVNNGDGPASISSVEDGDEDEDEDVIAGQTFVQYGHISIRASPLLEIPSSVIENSAKHTDLPVQSSIPISPYATKDGNVDFAGRESRFWPRIAKTASFLLVSLGALYLGKEAAVGITLCLVLAFKLSARDDGHNRKSTNCMEFRPGSSESDESISDETTYHEGDTTALSDESLLRKFAVYGNNDAEKTMEVDTHDETEETLKASRDTLLAKRKQLKRLNCIKLPPSASPCDEAIEESPSSTKASPRTWFSNAGSSMIAGNSNMVENPEELRKKGKFSKSKALFRHLRRGDSAPSSPMWSDHSEGIHGFSAVSDGSDSERSIHVPTGRRKSKFRPPSPVAKEVSREGANMRLLDDEQRLATEKKQTLLTEDGMPDGFCEGKMKQQNHNAFLFKEKQPACRSPTPTSGEAMTKAEIPVFLDSNQELPRKMGGAHQPSMRRPGATSVALEVPGRGNDAMANQDFRRAAIRRGERKQPKVRVGTAWQTSGLVIIAAGLLMGRIVAVAGLVCYWYVLSLFKKNRTHRRT